MTNSIFCEEFISSCNSTFKRNYLRKDGHREQSSIQQKQQRIKTLEVKMMFSWTTLAAILLGIICCSSISQVSADDQPVTTTDFAPHVTATCKGGTMNIRVLFSSPYTGAIHVKDFRTPSCMTAGNGTTVVGLSLNLQAKQGQSDYCGILVSNVGSADRTEERSIQLAVRVHKTLELADDKFYVITCGKTGFSRDDNSHVALKFMENDRRVRETVYGREYSIKAEITQSNGTLEGIKVKNCFAFDKKNTSIPLIDDKGCPLNSQIITKFTPSSDGLSATAVLKSMFKFPYGSEVHLQCDIIQCKNACPEDVCNGNGISASYTKGGRNLNDLEENMMLAATTVFVLDPADAALASPICEASGVRPAWLLWLAIALGILFLIMLLMNIFLCTAMSCSCARTEIIEKEPSIIEEYDPYRSWHGSQYGSRYSLHGRDGGGGGHNKGYTSGGSTIHSNRSLPIDSDHYAIVHSRPGSRHSTGFHHQAQNGGGHYPPQQHQNYQHRSRGPPSNL